MHTFVTTTTYTYVYSMRACDGHKNIFINRITNNKALLEQEHSLSLENHPNESLLKSPDKTRHGSLKTMKDVLPCNGIYYCHHLT